MKTTTVPVLLLLASAAVAAPPGNGAATPPPAPEDVLYAQNLLQNPGFEKSGFEKSRTKGWYATLADGMEAKFESAAPNKPVQPFEGRKALRLFVKDPAKYSQKALLGSWDEFQRGANGGKGHPRADVMQLVPVEPGSKYALRFRWRASGIYNMAAPGPDRGIVGVTVQCVWIDENGRYIQGQDPTLPKQLTSLPADSDEWATWAFPNFAAEAKLPYSKQQNVPFAAPAGAAYARVFFRFTCQRPKVKPEFWLDQVEFVKIPQGADLAPGAPAKPAAPAQGQAPGPAARPAPAGTASPAGPAPATEAKEGGVLKIRDCGGAEFHPCLALPGWKGKATLEKPDPAEANATAEFFAYRAGDVRIRAAAAFRAAPDRSLRAAWRFTPEQDADLAMLGIVLALPIEAFKGGSIRFDDADVELPQELREKPWYFSGNASAVTVRAPGGRELFSFTFAAPTRLSLQDDRYWKGSLFELRILPPGPSPYPAGAAQDFSLWLRGPAPAK